MTIARLLLYYVKGNEVGSKDMIQYLKMLLQNINNKEIPKLCLEIMSYFYKENEIYEFIDVLL